MAGITGVDDEQVVGLHADARIAGDAEIFLKKAGKQIAATQHRTANTLGATPTGHLGEAYEGIESSSGADKIELLIPGASRLRAAFGSYVVRPKNSKYLTILKKNRRRNIY
jgi:hypothetical protein